MCGLILNIVAASDMAPDDSWRIEGDGEIR